MSTVAFDNKKMAIGTNLAWHRKYQGLSRGDFSRLTGWTLDHIIDVEEFRTKFVTGDEVSTICKALGIRKETLLHVTPIAEHDEKASEQKAMMALGAQMAKSVKM